VLENVGPRQSIILARLSGGPLAETGVLQGMSGVAGVYRRKAGGRGALGFSESKVAIAGIRPIEGDAARGAAVSHCARRYSPRASFVSGGMRLEEIATPLAVFGIHGGHAQSFSRRSFAPWASIRSRVFRAGRISLTNWADPRTLEPGSMISVHLMSGT